jgi:hypothetical protein
MPCTCGPAPHTLPCTHPELAPTKNSRTCSAHTDMTAKKMWGTLVQVPGERGARGARERGASSYLQTQLNGGGCSAYNGEGHVQTQVSIEKSQHEGGYGYGGKGKGKGEYGEGEGGVRGRGRNRDAAYFTDTGSHSNAYTDGGEGGPWVSAKCWQTGSNAWKGRERVVCLLGVFVRQRRARVRECEHRSTRRRAAQGGCADTSAHSVCRLPRTASLPPAQSDPGAPPAPAWWTWLLWRPGRWQAPRGPQRTGSCCRARRTPPHSPCR